MPVEHIRELDWRPLEALARICRAHPTLPDLDPGEFMYMGRFDDRSGPPILLYKHTLTRRYLNVDHAGHAHRYTPGQSGERYQAIRDLASVLAWVQGAARPTPLSTGRPPLTR